VLAVRRYILAGVETRCGQGWWYVKCNCAEWKPNIDKVNAPLMFLHARNPTTSTGYDGIQFRFCPWCGNGLVEEHPNERVGFTSTAEHGK
jgi:hypothetical protein